MVIDVYLVFSVLLIILLSVGIIVASVYAYSFQTRPYQCPEQEQCPTCPDTLPCPSVSNTECVYNLLNFPITTTFNILSSVYYIGNTPYGGFLSDTNSTYTVDDLYGLELNASTATPTDWNFASNLLYTTISTDRLFVFTNSTNYLRSLYYGATPPDDGWSTVTKVELLNGLIIMTTGVGKFNMINYSPINFNNYTITVAAVNLDINLFSLGVLGTIAPTFPVSSPFYASQIWRLI